MLHAKMMPLLAEVYKGRIDTEQAKLYEYGGQKLEAQVVEGGVKFAAVEHVSLPSLRSCRCQRTDIFWGGSQRDLEYDPALYQRDRGELDWDQRSIGTTNILAGDGSSISPSKSVFYAGRASPAPSYGRGSPAPSVYDRYMSKGPTHVPNSSSEIELSGINTNADQLPLLASQQGYPDAVPPRPVSRSNQYYQQSPLGGTPAPGSMQQGQYPPVPTMYGEAPLRQPYRQPSNLSQNSQQAPSYSAPHSRQPSGYSAFDGQNMAGRGMYRQ